MAEAAYSTGQEPAHGVEVIVHVNEELDDDRRHDMKEGLEGTDGINTAEFCPLRYHLLLVQYNSERLSSLDVLKVVQSHAVGAQLIGPL
jgi:hypothetical protein